MLMLNMKLTVVTLRICLKIDYKLVMILVKAYSNGVRIDIIPFKI